MVIPLKINKKLSNYFIINTDKNEKKILFATGCVRRVNNKRKNCTCRKPLKYQIGVECEIEVDMIKDR